MEKDGFEIIIRNIFLKPWFGNRKDRHMEQEQQTPHKRRVRYKGKYTKKNEEKNKEHKQEKNQDTIEHDI